VAACPFGPSRHFTGNGWVLPQAVSTGVHCPTVRSGGDEGLIGPVHGDVLEQRQVTPARAITVEEVEQHEAVVGNEHCFSGSALATQCQLDHVALFHGLIAVTHGSSLRITFVTDIKAG
jgi:hypothetical protein